LFNWLDHISKIQEEWIKIEKETFSIWNNITRFQDFESLHDKTNALNVSIHEMRKIHDEELERYSKQYPNFFELSSSYLTSLEKTIQQLEHILDRLNDKSKNISYTWREYKNDIKQYNRLVNDYHNNGNKMNTEYSRLQKTSVIEERFSLNDTFVFLADSVSFLSIDEFVARCRDIGMVEQPFVDTDIDQNLPVFDNGYWFKYTTDDDTTAMLEVLEKEGRILQAGIQVIYPKTLSSSNLNEHYKNIVKIAESYYGIGQPTQVGNIEILNYGNSETAFYVSKLKDLLTFRVGNREFWG
jgi:hypothetical protein